jgi:DNA polymerase III alpha subunit
MGMSEFVHLHLHSQYSLLDGTIKIDDLVRKVGELRMPAVALTDHGGMMGTIDFYEKATRAGSARSWGARSTSPRAPGSTGSPRRGRRGRIT